MRQRTAEHLALAGPAVAAATVAAHAATSARGAWTPRVLAGAIVAAVALTALAQVAPDIAGGLGALMLVAAALSFPWQTILT